MKTSLKWMSVLIIAGCSRASLPVSQVAPEPPLVVAAPSASSPAESTPANPVETPVAEPPAADPAPTTFVSFPLEIERWEIPFHFEPRISLRATEDRAERLAPAPLNDSQLKFGPRFAAPDQGAPSRVEPVFDQPELSRHDAPRPAPPAFPGGGRLRVAAPRGSDPAPITANPPPLAERISPAYDPAAPLARGVTNVPVTAGREGPVPPKTSEIVAAKSVSLSTLPPEVEIPASANLPRIKLP